MWYPALVEVDVFFGGVLAPVGPGGEVVLAQRLEEQPAVEEIGRRDVVGGRGHEHGQRQERELDRLYRVAGALSADEQRYLIAHMTRVEQNTVPRPAATSQQSA